MHFGLVVPGIDTEGGGGGGIGGIEKMGAGGGDLGYGRGRKLM